MRVGRKCFSNSHKVAVPRHRKIFSKRSCNAIEKAAETATRQAAKKEIASQEAIPCLGCGVPLFPREELDGYCEGCNRSEGE